MMADDYWAMTALPAEIKSMNRDQLLERLQWRRKYPHFPGAKDEVAIINSEIVLRPCP